MLKPANLQVQVSNLRCTSGKLVIAGYILPKAPNATHRHRYVQHLTRRLPDNTPFFDVIRAVRTPQDQVMPHLAVQCGEKHVRSVVFHLSASLKRCADSSSFRFLISSDLQHDKPSTGRTQTRFVVYNTGSAVDATE